MVLQDVTKEPLEMPAEEAYWIAVATLREEIPHRDRGMLHKKKDSLFLKEGGVWGSARSTPGKKALLEEIRKEGGKSENQK